jgi:predicted O-linked N-acetylglucosamine transferase (SPINDLY family)
MTQRSTSRASIATEQLLETATGLHRAGDLARARSLYREILEEAPTHATALLRGGLLELQDARPEMALALIGRAAAIAPGESRHQVGLGQALQALGRFADAAAAYRRALVTDPHNAELQFALGTALQAQGNYPEAANAYEQAVKFQPDHFAAWNNLGICRQRGGQFSEAVNSYSRALQLRPKEAGAMANLGTALQALGRFDQAIELLGAAAALQPDVVPHAVNLGILLCRRRDFAAAESILRDAFARDPANADAAFNLGLALHGLGKPREAADLYRQAAGLRPGFADAFINLGNVHRESGEFAAAAAAYEAAMIAQPDSVAAMNNAGCLLRTLGRLDDAEDMLRRGLRLDPQLSALHDNLGSVLKDAGELDAAIACYRRAMELDPDNSACCANLAYSLCFQSGDARQILGECLNWGARFARPQSAARRAHLNDLSPYRRLRIGYVSPDFREHCQSLFTIPLLAQHDHASFEIFCYASVERPDEHTRRIRAYADEWREVRCLDDAGLAERIHADRIDILVDLTMHMARGRPLMFARKPAPIQVAWLAYPGTTGNFAMDYRISDPRLDPAGFDSHYSERTVRLPDSFWCYDPLTEQPQVNPLPALERGYLTFGCLNNPCKLTDGTLSLWAPVMQALRGARLRLLAPPGRHRERLSQRLEFHGIARERVDFVPYLARAEYLRSYHDIDLGLDTVPYNGHTTSLDSLWMGVPTVTRVGSTCVGRGGLSQLFQLDLAELAAATDADFVAAAVALGRDLSRLARLRQELRSRLERSPLMDSARFARNMETVYRRMWTRYCAPSDADANAIMR